MVEASAARIVAGSRFFRAAVVSLLLSGIGLSATAPQLTIFLVSDLGASLPVAGLYYLTNLAAPIAGYLVGRISDRRGNRLLLFRICALAGAVGWTVIGLSHSVWVPFVMSIVALSIAGAAMGQLFAACRDHLNRHPTTADNRVISLIRMAYTGGWVIGPVLGSWFGHVVGLRPLLFATAGCMFAQILPLGRQRVLRYDRVVETEVAERPRRIGMAPLLIFTGLTVIAMAGDTIKFGYLPLYMEQDLKLAPAVLGAVIGIQPLIEFALMPVAGRLADRYGPLRVFPAGIALGVVAYAIFAVSTSAAGLFAGQFLIGLQWSCIAGLGVTIAQDFHPTRVGTASGIFMSAVPIAGAVGGFTGGVGVAWLGLPHVFYLPTVLSVVALVGLTALAIWERPARVGGSQESSQDPAAVVDTDR
jgi:SET family sugar efflux transporter-like MFS transporter